MHVLPRLLLVGLFALTAHSLSAELYEIRTTNAGGADTFVSTNPGETNRGRVGYLNVKSFGAAPSGSRKAYLRFNLETPPFTGDMTVESLQLTLADFGSKVPVVFRVYVLNADTAPGSVLGANDWDEIDLTWENAPANNRAHGFMLNVGSGPGSAVELGEVVIPPTSRKGDLFVWSPKDESQRARLQSIVRATLLRPPGRRNLTFVITRQSHFPDVNSGFYSKESQGGAHAPTLLVRLPAG